MDVNPENRPWKFAVLCGLSLSVGWGIRGNFGHEWGAWIPGALAAMAAVLISQRGDWQRRSALFGLFGAIGWGFGGSMSYMQVIGYTHSGHSPSQLYGFFCLFVMGFLWAALGGAATALPAVWSRRQISEFILPACAVQLVFWLRDVLEDTFLAVDPDFRHQDPLYWFDTDWTSVLLALAVAVGFRLARRRSDNAVTTIIVMCVGWWIGFLVFPVALGIRMTPPRGDSWAGNLGMVAALFLWFQHRRWHTLAWSLLTAGMWGGIGFAGAGLVKLCLMQFGWSTNYHSILEQTYGLMNGIGIGLVMYRLSRSQQPVSDDPHETPWLDIAAPALLLLWVPYVNFRKCVEDWVKAKALPESIYWMPPIGWFNLAWIGTACLCVWLLCRHRRNPLALLPSSWLGRTHLLFLMFLWGVVMMNWQRALPSFAPQRMVTEGTIFVNSLLITAFSTAWALPTALRDTLHALPPLRTTLFRLLCAAAVFTLLPWGIVRVLYGDRHAGESRLHIRFGPNRTAVETIDKGKAHP